MIRYSVIFLSLFLTSCSGISEPRDRNLYYEGPGSRQDLINSRYECVRELKSISSNNDININQRSSFTCGELRACIASKGYIQVPKGEHNLLLPGNLRVPCKW